MPATTRSARQVAEELLAAAVSRTPGDMADCYAPEVVIEMPFAVAALFPSRIETTREELRARFQAGTGARRYREARDVAIHQTTDPDVAIVEYELCGAMVATGEEFASRYAMVITVRDGFIVHSRDYSNPVEGARLLGRIPELISALS
jgi:uncharacterized protein